MMVVVADLTESAVGSAYHVVVQVLAEGVQAAAYQQEGMVAVANPEGCLVDNKMSAGQEVY